MDKLLLNLIRRHLRHSTNLLLKLDKWHSMLNNYEDKIVLEELQVVILEHKQIGRELLHLGHLIQNHSKEQANK